MICDRISSSQLSRDVSPPHFCQSGKKSSYPVPHWRPSFFPFRAHALAAPWQGKKRPGTADWRAFMREVHMTEQEERRKLLHSLPEIER